MKYIKHFKKSLIIVAHPDDETLWFSSVALRTNADLVCVTCGNSPRLRQTRKRELLVACNLLGIKNITVLDHDDIFGYRLDLRRLSKELEPFTTVHYDEVYSHGPYGETNEHFHHQDVSYAVHSLFKDVLSTAWNLHPQIVNTLNPEEYILKKYIMGTIYQREYRKLKSTYEISGVEKFVHLSRSSVDIYYWGIANFGDHHQKLALKYRDIWGYSLSPYEQERHEVIVSLVTRIGSPSKILEMGAHEGLLTSQLMKLGSVDCVEKSPILRRRLLDQGFNVVDDFDTGKYDIVVLASVLEYMDEPTEFLSRIKSNYLVVEVINSFRMKSILSSLNERYSLIKSISISPRWEKMYHDSIKERLEIYRLGCVVRLYEKKN